jgi:uncharacterized protein (DUF1015 family)
VARACAGAVPLPCRVVADSLSNVPADESPDGAPDAADGLSLAPFRALRYAVGPERLGTLLCPPYDVIDAAERARLLAADPHNAVALVLPVPPGASDEEGEAYRRAATQLTDWTVDGELAVDDVPALYIYEMCTPNRPDEAGTMTRGLVGAVELRDPADGVILPHENTMAGPVADRLALMTATAANLEPIYLVYDGGGPASQLVADVDPAAVIASAHTPDGVAHRLWAITDPETHQAVASDLATRQALIADGHHRYVTYLELQRERDEVDGPGPWDRGLALLVDSSTYGPQVHPIHRVITAMDYGTALAAAADRLPVSEFDDLEAALAALNSAGSGFHAVLTDGSRAALVGTPSIDLLAANRLHDEPAALLDLDVTVLHRVLIAGVWQLPDDEATVGYAHDVAEAVSAAQAAGGTAVLLRATPVAAVAAVAAVGARMPRKSTLFTPKPASGMLFRRFADQ